MLIIRRAIITSYKGEYNLIKYSSSTGIQKSLSKTIDDVEKYISMNNVNIYHNAVWIRIFVDIPNINNIAVNENSFKQIADQLRSYDSMDLRERTKDLVQITRYYLENYKEEIFDENFNEEKIRMDRYEIYDESIAEYGFHRELSDYYDGAGKRFEKGDIVKIINREDEMEYRVIDIPNFNYIGWSNCYLLRSLKNTDAKNISVHESKLIKVGIS